MARRMFQLSDGLNIRTFDLRLSVCCDLDDVPVFKWDNNKVRFTKDKQSLETKEREKSYIIYYSNKNI